MELTILKGMWSSNTPPDLKVLVRAGMSLRWIFKAYVQHTGIPRSDLRFIWCNELLGDPQASILEEAAKLEEARGIEVDWEEAQVVWVRREFVRRCQFCQKHAGHEGDREENGW